MKAWSEIHFPHPNFSSSAIQFGYKGYSSCPNYWRYFFWRYFLRHCVAPYHLYRRYFWPYWTSIQHWRNLVYHWQDFGQTLLSRCHLCLSLMNFTFCWSSSINNPKYFMNFFDSCSECPTAIFSTIFCLLIKMSSAWHAATVNTALLSRTLIVWLTAFIVSAIFLCGLRIVKLGLDE